MAAIESVLVLPPSLMLPDQPGCRHQRVTAALRGWLAAGGRAFGAVGHVPDATAITRDVIASEIQRRVKSDRKSILPVLISPAPATAPSLEASNLAKDAFISDGHGYAGSSHWQPSEIRQ